MLLAPASLAAAGDREVPAAGDASAGAQMPEALSPTGVIEAQLSAFSEWSRDPGAIARAFIFASAENRKAIGSLERYRRMLSNPPYVSLIDNRGWLVGRTVPKGEGIAAVLVTVDDRSDKLRVFRYLLIRSTDRGKQRWYVDTVLPAPVIASGSVAPEQMKSKQDESGRRGN
ncbi:MAG: hypothetical protein AAGF31_06300 [Planctomycetota bacterium]